MQIRRSKVAIALACAISILLSNFIGFIPSRTLDRYTVLADEENAEQEDEYLEVESSLPEGIIEESEPVVEVVEDEDSAINDIDEIPVESEDIEETVGLMAVPPEDDGVSPLADAGDVIAISNYSDTCNMRDVASGIEFKGYCLNILRHSWLSGDEFTYVNVESDADLVLVDRRTSYKDLLKILYAGYPTNAYNLQSENGLSTSEFCRSTQQALWKVPSSFLGMELSDIIVPDWFRNSVKFMLSSSSDIQNSVGVFVSPDTHFDPLNITFRKTNDENELLGGSSFVLSACEDGLFGSRDLSGVSIAGADGISFNAENNTISFTTRSNETVSINNIYPGTYYLTEADAPDGYICSSATRFSIDTDGFVTKDNGERQDKLIQITNYEDSSEDSFGSVIFKKIDTNGTLLVGAQYELIVDTSYTEDLFNKIIIFNTREDRVEKDFNNKKIIFETNGGNIRIDSLIKGQEYILREVKAPSGYNVAGDVTFSIDSVGNVCVNGSTKNSNIITVTDSTGAFRISKVDSDGNPLGYTTFTLTPSTYNADIINGIQIKDKDGKNLVTRRDVANHTITFRFNSQTTEAYVTNINVGSDYSYQISETTAPTGYFLDTTSYTVRVFESGSVSVTRGAGLSRLTPDGVVRIVNSDTTSVTLHKQTNKNMGTSTALEGARFELKPVDNSDSNGFADITITNATDVVYGDGVITFTTTTTDVKIDGIKCNAHYTLQEISSPDTVFSDDTIHEFYVSSDGTTHVRKGNSSYSNTTTKQKIVITNYVPQQITLNKMATNSTTPLAGATFKLITTRDSGIVHMSEVRVEDKNGNNLIISRDGNDHSITFITSDTATNIYIYPGDYYMVVETKAPDGYIGDDTEYHFTYSTYDNSLRVSVGDSSNYQTKRSIDISNTLATADITISKSTMSGDFLAGALFELTPNDTSARDRFSDIRVLDESGNDIGTYETNKITFRSTNSNMTLANLVLTRSYNLVEVEAPRGYAEPTESYVITPSFRQVSDASGVYVDIERIPYDQDAQPSTDTGKDIVITNVTPTPVPRSVSLTKLDVRGDNLEGATFLLAPLTTASADIGSNDYKFDEVTFDNATDVEYVQEGNINTWKFTTTAGELTINNLRIGAIYMIKEYEAPEGYDLDETVYYVSIVSEDVIFIQVAGESDYAEAEGLEFVNYTSARTVSFNKVDMDGSNLAGAIFELVPADELSADRFDEITVDGAADVINVDNKVTFTSNGEDILINGLIGTMSYVITEIEAPEGYEMSDCKYVLTINLDGTVEVKAISLESGDVVSTDVVASEVGLVVPNVSSTPTPTPTNTPTPTVTPTSSPTPTPADSTSTLTPTPTPAGSTSTATPTPAPVDSTSVTPTPTATATPTPTTTTTTGSGNSTPNTGEAQSHNVVVALSLFALAGFVLGGREVAIRKQKRNKYKIRKPNL